MSSLSSNKDGLQKDITHNEEESFKNITDNNKAIVVKQVSCLNDQEGKKWLLSYFFGLTQVCDKNTFMRAIATGASLL